MNVNEVNETNEANKANEANEANGCLVHGRKLISPLYCGRLLCLSVLKSVSKSVNPKKMKTQPLKKIQKFHFKRPYMYA